MQNNGWRTIFMQPHDRLGIREGQMILEDGDEEHVIPLEQLRSLMVASEKGSISLPLLVNLAEQNIAVLLCDKKHSPIAQVISIDSNINSAGHLMDQAEWAERKCRFVWRQIVKMKLKNQCDLLRHLKHNEAETVKECLINVAPGDATNREAVAAKIYFRSLFGNEFIRHAPDDTNAALNYGYTIICSAFSRAIVLHGYSTALGIHHRSRQNCVNLSCDLMEPFRPLVDRMVQQNIGRTLDWPYCQELVALMYSTCILAGRKTDVVSAIDAFTLSVIQAMETPRCKIKEVRFE